MAYEVHAPIVASKPADSRQRAPYHGPNAEHTASFSRIQWLSFQVMHTTSGGIRQESYCIFLSTITAKRDILDRVR